MWGSDNQKRCLTEPELQSWAAAMAHHVSPGDTILLKGSVGAGKTTFARAFIQSILIEPEDVPSPTFTLVQTYETRRGTLWHSDLYRLSSVFELEELGLAEAFQSAICLVEWPDILASDSPQNALTLAFEVAEDKRRVSTTYSDPKWAEILDRAKSD
jgi:tRNA threonylcarbamoyladenosine biosynthesis protein TsaE